MIRSRGQVQILSLRPFLPTEPMKRAMLMAAGLGCFFASIAIGIFVLVYLVNGAGVQFFPFGLSLGGIFLGLIHVVGLAVVSIICFAFGAYLSAHSLAKSAD